MQTITIQEKPFQELVNKYINSPKLTSEQKQQLKVYFEHLTVNGSKTELTDRWMRTIFMNLRDFGVVLGNRSYLDATEQDFGNYYELIISNRNVNETTLEAYCNVLRHFFDFIFENEGRIKQWKKIELKVIAKFKENKMKEYLEYDPHEKSMQSIEGTIYRYLNDKDLLPEQRSVFLKLDNYLKGRLKNSVHNRVGVFQVLVRYAKFIKKPFDVGKDSEHIDAFLCDINNKGFSLKTIDCYTHKIKYFYKYLHYGRLVKTDSYPDIVKDIRLVKPNTKKSREDIPTDEEVGNMTTFSDTPQKKCVVNLSYDAATRPEELIRIKLKDIHEDKYGFEIDIHRIKQKGKETNIVPFRVIESEPYLREWLNHHPYSKETHPEASLFVDLRHFGRPLGTNGIYKTIKLAAKRAGIKRRIYPYSLRHKRITDWKLKGYSDDFIVQLTGHTENTMILKNYSHLTPNDVNQMRLKEAGKIKGEQAEKKEILMPIVCPRCKRTNPADSRYCNCGMALNLKQVVEDTKKRETYDNKMNDLFADSEFRELLKDYLKKKSQGS